MLWLGEALTGTCGKPWETYGIDMSQQTMGVMGIPTPTVATSNSSNPPYTMDAYHKCMIDGVSQWEINVGDFEEYMGSSR